MSHAYGKYLLQSFLLDKISLHMQSLRYRCCYETHTEDMNVFTIVIDTGLAYSCNSTYCLP